MTTDDAVPENDPRPAPPPADPPPVYPEYPPAPGGAAPHAGTSGLAVAALVVGIVGLCFCFGFIAIILGSAARRRIAATGQSGDGLAIAGIVLGWCSVAFIAYRILQGIVGASGA